MIKAIILGCHNTMATTVFGPMDIFNQAGRLWNRVHQSLQNPFFEVTLVSADGQPFRAANNVMIQPHCGIEETGQTDLIIISAATHIKQILEKHPGLVPWLKRRYCEGAHIASICTGVFLLAETGLLDGKSATLHWGFTQMFRNYYPAIPLDSNRMFIDHGRLYCSAGVNAGMDLSLYLVQKFCGRQIAVQCAKTMILDFGRPSQTPYGGFLFHGDHGDPVVLEIQRWMEAHHTEPMNYDGLAQQYRMSRRSLERRFKKASGFSPLEFLQQLRVESAKRMLENGGLSFSEITYMVGYEDIPFFRRVFTRWAGLRPKDYQNRFSGYGASQPVDDSGSD